MIKIYVKKLNIFFTLFLLVFYTLLTPFTVLAENGTSHVKTNVEEQEKVKIELGGKEDEIPLYESININDLDEEDNILTFIKNEEEVTILEIKEEYSLVEYGDKELSEDKDETILYEGYIENKYLLDGSLDEEDIDSNEVVEEEIVEKENEQDKPLKEENNPVVEEIKDTEVDETDEVIKEEKYKNKDDVSSADEKTNNVQNFSLTSEQILMRGVGLRSPTNVRKETSTKSAIVKQIPQGTIFEYKTFSEDWYEVSEENKVIGYVHDKHIRHAEVDPEKFRGIAKRKNTNIRVIPSTKADKAKVVSRGTVLTYRGFNKNWYEVYEGNKSIGFIHRKHVENSVENQKVLRGVGLRSPTNIREGASTTTKVVKRLPQGTIFEYKTFSEDWYEVSEGNKVIGYVHDKHIQHAEVDPKKFRGIAKRKNTNIRVIPSTKADKAKVVSRGTVLTYRGFNKNWYEVYEGNKSIGFIHRKHVENSVENQKVLRGVGLRSPTNIREGASTTTKVVKRLPQGTIFEYKTFSEDWYEVYEGNKVIGYVHDKHIQHANRDPMKRYGIAAKRETNIRVLPSTKTDVLTTVPKDSLIEMEVFNKNWNSVTVIVDGKKRTGFIHNNHFQEIDSPIYESKYNISLNEATNMQMKVNPQTDSKYAWVSKSYIQNNRVTASALNVRVGPGTNYRSIGTLSHGATVDVVSSSGIGNWMAIRYNHNTWVSATREDVSYCLNPNNFLDDDKQRFQFLDLSKPSGANVATLNEYLKGKGTLEGQGEAFIDGAVTHGINDIYLISHAILETGNGKSELARGIKVGRNYEGKAELVTSSNSNRLTNVKTVYNMFGIGAYDGCAVECGAKRAYNENWTSPAKAITGGAKFIGNSYIKRGQNTLYKMRWNPDSMDRLGYASHQYATDIGWARKQVNTIYNLYKEMGLNSPILDVPLYK